MKVNKIFIILLLSNFISSCYKDNDPNVWHVAISAEYPPFEYTKQNEIVGFDVDLMKLIAKKMGKNVQFDNMQFSTILPTLVTKQADMAISTITVTPERASKVTFSQPYYFESMSIVYAKDKELGDVKSLCGKKIAAQLGTTMALWLSSELKCANSVLMNTNPIAIEALKVGQVDAVVMDGTQAAVFSQKNPGLAYHPIVKSSDGYAIAFPKNSTLVNKINATLDDIKKTGALDELKKKWFGASHA